MIVLLSFLLLIEILSNSSQTENVQHLDASINEIYADRLLAQDLLFKISERINRQKTSLLTEISNDSLISSMNVNFKEIEGFLNAYDKTKLTKEEAIIFGKLKTETASLKKMITKCGNGQLFLNNLKDQYSQQLDSASVMLYSLSEIQMTRSKELRADSYKTLSFSGIINELNWTLSIIIALVIFAIVLASKSIIPKIPEQLN